MAPKTVISLIDDWRAFTAEGNYSGGQLHRKVVVIALRSSITEITVLASIRLYGSKALNPSQNKDILNATLQGVSKNLEPAKTSKLPESMKSF